MPEVGSWLGGLGGLGGGCGCCRSGLLFLAWLLWLRAWSVGMRCCFSAGVCGGEPSRADVACWGGWGPHTPCARQIGPHPPQPTPPSRHGSLRCVWGRRQKCGLPFAPWVHRFPAFDPPFSFSRVTPVSGAGAHGIARARGEPFRQSLLAVCGGRLTP
jgi:hypothetical protein